MTSIVKKKLFRKRKKQRVRSQAGLPEESLDHQLNIEQNIYYFNYLFCIYYNNTELILVWYSNVSIIQVSGMQISFAISGHLF